MSYFSDADKQAGYILSAGHLRQARVTLQIAKRSIDGTIRLDSIRSAVDHLVKIEQITRDGVILTDIQAVKTHAMKAFIFAQQAAQALHQCESILDETTRTIQDRRSK